MSDEEITQILKNRTKQKLMREFLAKLRAEADIKDYLTPSRPQAPGMMPGPGK
jgi:hypothetical protein